MAQTQTPAKKTATKTESAQERTVRMSKEREQRFLKLAPKRMTKALKALDQVTALANRRSYTYTEDQYKKMHAALTATLEKLHKAYTLPTAQQNGEGFKF